MFTVSTSQSHHCTRKMRLKVLSVTEILTKTVGGLFYLTTLYLSIHWVSKNIPPFACNNFDIHESIFVIFGGNVVLKK